MSWRHGPIFEYADENQKFKKVFNAANPMQKKKFHTCKNCFWNLKYSLQYLLPSKGRDFDEKKQPLPFLLFNWASLCLVALSLEDFWQSDLITSATLGQEFISTPLPHVPLNLFSVL